MFCKHIDFKMNRRDFLARVYLVASLLLCCLPTATRAGDWLGGESAIYTIKTVEPNGQPLHTAVIMVTDERMKNPIYVVGSIRRERASTSTTGATVDDLRPGARIRAHGGHSSSPFGFIADKILILKK
jgi:hypothetical protein